MSPTETYITGAPAIGSRWRHRARGTYYTVINHGHFQFYDPTFDDEPVTIYEAESPDHAVYVRPTAEFLDGRFEEIKS